MSYRSIIFAHDYQDEMVARFFANEINVVALIDHFMEWETGEEETLDAAPWGSSDTLFALDKGSIILSYNRALGYAALTLKD